jgi:hypothetical protein
MQFREGQLVKLIFRPEDVLLSRSQSAAEGCLAAGVILEASFVGAYERLRIRLDPGGSSSDPQDTPYYLTTETPEKGVKPIIATRAKPETLATSLKVGDRVYLNLTSFTLLPRDTRSKTTIH